MYQLALPHTQLAAQFRDAAYTKQYEQSLSDWVEDAIGGHSAAIRPEIAFVASAATTILAASISHDGRRAVALLTPSNLSPLDRPPHLRSQPWEKNTPAFVALRLSNTKAEPWGFQT